MGTKVENKQSSRNDGKPHVRRRAVWETDAFAYGINVLLAEKPLDKSICKAK